MKPPHDLQADTLAQWSSLQTMEQATNPVFRPTHHCKTLCSPGNGAGWVSWAPRAASEAFLVWMLTYEPLIEGLEWKVGTGESCLTSPPGAGVMLTARR